MSCCGLPLGSFCTRSLMAYLPMSSLFLWSMARFLRAVATAHTTLSTSMRRSSTSTGRPRSFLTAALMSTLGCQ
uniref:Putative secreted protein n=1 Tax=Ixodes ricinus TaxID=34613 RepID=A0A6B0U4I6_IXORI